MWRHSNSGFLESSDRWAGTGIQRTWPFVVSLHCACAAGGCAFFPTLPYLSFTIISVITICFTVTLHSTVMGECCWGHYHKKEREGFQFLRLSSVTSILIQFKLISSFSWQERGTATSFPNYSRSLVVEEVAVHNTGISLLLSTSVWVLLSPPIERRETRPTA